jgi:hypothetical protein
MFRTFIAEGDEILDTLRVSGIRIQAHRLALMKY